MTSVLRKAAVWLLAAAIAAAPMAADATTYQYFRMYGGGQGGTVTSPPPVGTLSYSVSGPATATVGQPYAATASVGGAVGATAFSVYSGTFPPGLTLDPSSGAISGSPTQAGSYSPILVVTDSQAHQGFASWSLSVSPGLAVSGSPSSIGTVGQAYAAQFSASGGSSPYTFSTASALPPGLTLSASGLLSGSPNTSGTYSNIVIQVQDAANATASSAAFTINVASPLAVSWTPAAGQVGVVYAPAAPVVSGGRAPYLYSLNGQAPSGLVFDNSTGDLNGTPSTAGSYSLGVTVIDADGRSAASGLSSLSIAAGAVPAQGGPLAFAALPSTVGQLGVGYLSSATASGGTSPYTFTSIGAALPPGLSLASNGTLSGTPSQLGTFAGIQLEVTDAAAAVVQSTTFSITISAPPPLTISGNPSTSAQVGASYTATFTAFDGTGSGYTFSLAAGTLPPGLSLSNVGGADGAIAGTPSYVGTYSGLVVRVTDSGGNTADSNPFSITVAAPAGPAIALAGAPGAATVGAAYSAQLSASGGSGTGYAFSIASGSLPAGLTLNTASGLISGTPSTAQTASFTAQVIDSAGDVASAAYSITVSGNTATVALTSADKLRAGAAIAGTLSTDIAGATWSMAQSPTSPALGLAVAGATFSGTAPSVSAPTAFTIAGTASAGASIATSASVALTVAPPLSVAGGVAAGNFYGDLGNNYSLAGPAAAGVAGTATYTLLQNGSPVANFGTLCQGLSFSATDAGITGPAQALCSVTGLTVEVTDSFDGATAVTSPAFSFTVEPTLTVSGTPASGFVGAAYSFVPTVSGGSGSYASFAERDSAGTLAALGLTFSTVDGSITGTPTANGSWSGTISVTDSHGVVATSAALTVTVSANTATASLTSPSTLRSGSAITGTLSTSMTGATWSFSQTPASPSLGLVASGSAFSGTAPSVAASTGYSFTATATATAGATSLQSSPIGLTVLPPLTLAGGPSGTQAIAVGAAMTATAAPSISGLVGTASYGLLKSGAAYATLSTDCPGVSFSSATGVISGTPTASCSESALQLTATDSADGTTATDAATFALSISGSPVVIATTSQPPIEAVGETNYAWHPSTSGGTGPYTYAFSGGTGSGSTGSISGGAWNGITFGASGIANTGTPTAAGTLTGFSVVATDSRGVQSAPVQFTLTVNPLLAISGSWPSSCVVGQTCSATFTATGGQADYPYTSNGGGTGYSWGVTGTAISGLQITSGVDGAPVSPSGGVNGPGPAVYAFVPSAAGTINGTMAVANTYSSSIDGAASAITVAAQTASLSLAATNVHQGYAISGTVSSNYTNPAWSFTQSPTTPGLGLSVSGSTLSGSAPTVASPTTFTVVAKATASGGGTATASGVSLTVMPPLTIAGGPSGTVYADVGTAMTATTGPTYTNLTGSPSYTLLQNGAAITLSAVCPGLNFSTVNGIISGTPTAACSTGASLTIRITDSGDSSTATTAAAFALQVAAAPTLAASTSSASGFAGETMASITMTESGGQGTLTYSEVDGTGTLAALGLSVSGSTGTIAPISGGKPSAAGSWTGKVAVVDGAGASAQTASITITVGAALAISGAPPAATAGAAYSFTPTVSGGSGGNSFAETDTSGTLAGIGLSLNASTGAITGTATTGSWSGSIKVTDAGGGTASLAASITAASSTSGAGYAWGYGGNGNIGNGGTSEVNVATAVSGGLTFAKMSVSRYVTCGITTAGAAYCWGSGYSSTPTAISGMTSGVTDISVDTNSVVCAVQNGTPYCWGGGSWSTTPTAVSGFSGTAISVYSGYYGRSTVVLNSGGLYVFSNSANSGYGVVGGANVSSTNPRAVSGNSAGETLCYITANAGVNCFGNGTGYMLGNGSTTNVVSSVPGVATIADGSSVTDLAVGATVGLAVAHGALYCWGSPTVGECGDGTTNTVHTTPTMVPGFSSGVTAVSVKNTTVCAVKSGVAYCWGSGSFGQLGNNNTSNASTPQIVQGMGTAHGVGADFLTSVGW